MSKQVQPSNGQTTNTKPKTSQAQVSKGKGAKAKVAKAAMLRVQPEDRQFKRCLAVSLCVFMMISIIVPLITVPEKSRDEKEALPPQLTKFILAQKKEPVQKPKVIPKPRIPEKVKEKEVAKKEVKKKVVKPKEVAPKQVVQKPKAEEVAAAKPKRTIKATKQERTVARAEASQAGVLAMQQGLSELTNRKVKSVSAQKIGKVSATAEPRKASAMAAVSQGGSGGEVASTVNSGAVAGIAVDHQTLGQTVQAGQVLADAGAAVVAQKTARQSAGQRDETAIRKVFERNKSAIYSIYARAQRKNEDLAGKLVLEIMISASGEVEEVKILDSELEDSKLERKILTRVRMFSFGQENVAALTMRYTFDFVAS